MNHNNDYSPGKVPGAGHTGRRSLRPLFFIFLIPFAGVALAALLYFTGLPSGGQTNKGVLITPPLSLSYLGLKKTDGTAFQAADLNGKWGMLITAGSACAAQCREELVITGRVIRALNKDAGRVERYVLTAAQELQLSGPGEAVSAGATLLHAKPEDIGRKLDKMQLHRVRILLTDPLGNIMMAYEQKNTGSDLLKDLQRLLRASNIG